MKIKIIANEIDQEVRDKDSEIYKNCKEINTQNTAESGGTLHCPFSYIIWSSDILITAKDKNDNILGYIALKILSDKRLYINQLAVALTAKRKGIASAIYDALEKYCDGFNTILANVRAENTASTKLHLKLGYIKDQNCYQNHSNPLFSKKTDKTKIIGSFKNLYNFPLEVDIKDKEPPFEQ